MARLHKLRTYKDGYKLVEYCAVCSAEGNSLLYDCNGSFPNPLKPIVFQGLTEEEFDAKYQKALDDAKGPI